MTYYNTDSSSYVKDMTTGAVLNTDRAAFDAYLQRKKQSSKIAELEESVMEIKSELTEIRSLLLQIVNR